MSFPDIISIKVINDLTKNVIPNIAITIRLFAKRKNDYRYTYITNQDGSIIITKDDLLSKIDENKNMFLMDYSSTLEDCESKIELNNISGKIVKQFVNNMIIYKDAYKIPEERIVKLANVDNVLYKESFFIKDFDNQKLVDVIMSIKAI